METPQPRPPAARGVTAVVRASLPLPQSTGVSIFHLSLAMAEFGQEDEVGGEQMGGGSGGEQGETLSFLACAQLCL